MSSFKDTFLYKTLGLHIKLKPVIDQGSGHPVILLHGIGRSNEVWNHVVNEFKNHQGYRVIAFDLLGFGSSPKPDWIDYTIDDHAQAIINSIDKLKLREPCIIVGHSMGCLIAVRVAKLRPDLIKQLVLFEMPIFEGLPTNRLARLRLNTYIRYSKWVINSHPKFDKKNLTFANKMSRKLIAFSVDKDTWIPFTRSLENVILNHQVSQDLKELTIPIDVIYGTFDMFVIRGHTQKVIGSIKDDVKHHKIRARHVISIKSSRFIAKRVFEGFNDQIQKNVS